MKKIEPWIQTYTGKKFWLTEPDENSIDIEDIAHSLSMQCRYAGHSKFFYSVAQHSWIVCGFLPEKFLLAGLLHDASEAYIGDITSPLKQYIKGDYILLESMIQMKIFHKFGVEINKNMADAVKFADLQALRLEALTVLNHPPIDDWHSALPKMDTFKYITEIDRKEAKQNFLTGFHDLTNNKYA